MPITNILERNAMSFRDEVALVELNPEQAETRRVTWREYELIEPTKTASYRREITWEVFNEKANRLANMLVQNGIGDVFEEIARIGSDDVLVGISFPRYSTRTLECMRFARQNGAQVIGLTDGDMSPLRDASDVCLCASTDMASFVDSLAAPLSVINALIVSVGLSRRDDLAAHFRRLEGIWNAHSVYIDKKDE